MAELSGNIVFTGTTNNLCFYRMERKAYVRKASNLTGKRVKKDKRFARTMAYAGMMGKASRIGSAVYKALPKDFREHWMYRAFTGEALSWLKQGKSDAETLSILMKTYAEVWVMKNNNTVVSDRRVAMITKALQKKEVVVSPYILSITGDAGAKALYSNLSARRGHVPPCKTGHITYRLLKMTV